MQGWRYVALALVSCVGCLDALVSDEPGYSKLVLPKGSDVPSADDDAALDGRIDMYDGVDAPLVELRAGFAEGKAVGYWDLGPGTVRPVSGFRFLRCNNKGEPTAAAVDHPLLFDSLPGDRDYGPLRQLQPVCLTSEYAGQLITSVEALDDAIDIGIALDPGEASIWMNCPVVAKGVSLSLGGDAAEPAREVYYRGKRIHCMDMAQEEGEFSNAARPTVGNVYELRRQGDAAPPRVVFSVPPRNAEGERSPAYSPLWKVVNVTIASTEMLDDYARESDIVMMDGMALAPAHAGVLSVKVTTSIVNRPLQFGGAP